MSWTKTKLNTCIVQEDTRAKDRLQLRNQDDSQSSGHSKWIQRP